MSVMVVFCTCPQELADDIADAVVRDRLAACVNIVPAIRSVYWWEGALEADDESLLIIKTKDDLLKDLMDRIREIHPYQVPEMIALEVKAGNADYLRWVIEETR